MFLTFILPISIAQNENQKAAKLRANNKIKEMLKFEFDFGLKDSILYEHTFYDKNGNTTLSKYFDKKGNVTTKYVLDYNSEGLVIKQTGYDKLDTITTRLVYEYDSNGNLTDYKQLSNDGSSIRIHQKRKYNDLGQNIELHNKQFFGDDFYIGSKYIYNATGQYQAIEQYETDGTLKSKDFYLYDHNDKLVQIFTKEGHVKELVIGFKYDNKNQLVEKAFSNSKLLGTNIRNKTINYSYDSTGNLISEKQYKSDKIWKIIHYHYVYY